MKYTLYRHSHNTDDGIIISTHPTLKAAEERRTLEICKYPPEQRRIVMSSMIFRIKEEK